MSQELKHTSLLEPLAHPDMRRINLRDILFLGELYCNSPSDQKRICIFLEERLIICDQITASSGEYLIEGAGSSMKFCFDLKFENIYSSEKLLTSNIIGVKFQKQGHQGYELYFTEKQKQKFHILHILKKLLAQRGFHQLFKPTKKLGAGNFATVFEVKRYQDNKKFAVKAFSKNHLFSSPKGKQSLINELNVLKYLNHENVIKMEAVYESDNSLYVLLELIHGNHFFHTLRKMDCVSFNPEQIYQFMKKLLSGLNHLHNQRIMHRDIKPENIMLRNGKFQDPVIVDFGLGTFCDVDQYIFYRCGTPGYIAPQIISLKDNKNHVEPVCDIFSAGAIFHILLTGRVLFEGNEFDQVYDKNKKMEFSIDPKEIQQKSQNSYAYDLLIKMLQKSPQQRITSQEALMHPFFSKEMASCSPILTSIEDSYEKYLSPNIIKF